MHISKLKEASGILTRLETLYDQKKDLECLAKNILESDTHEIHIVIDHLKSDDGDYLDDRHLRMREFASIFGVPQRRMIKAEEQKSLKTVGETIPDVLAIEVIAMIIRHKDSEIKELKNRLKEIGYKF